MMQSKCRAGSRALDQNEVYTTSETKIALSPHNDKRYIMPGSIDHEDIIDVNKFVYSIYIYIYNNIYLISIFYTLCLICILCIVCIACNYVHMY